MKMNAIRGATATVLLAIGASALASDGISIPAAGTHDGSLDTRNGAIRIGRDATVSGALESRNGLIETGESVTAGNVSTRNGAILLGANGRYGHIESRNGGVELGKGGEAGNIETRNGEVTVGGDSRVGRLNSRNGGVEIGPAAVVTGNVRTRNGGVQLAPESVVEGRVSTRNGGVELVGATVEEGIRTRTGDIVLKQASRTGDLVIEITEDNGDNSGWFDFGGSGWPEAGSIRVLEGSRVDGDIVLLLAEDYDERLPVVEIAEDAHITGSVRVDHRVELVAAGRIDGKIERTGP